MEKGNSYSVTYIHAYVSFPSYHTLYILFAFVCSGINLLGNQSSTIVLAKNIMIQTDEPDDTSSSNIVCCNVFGNETLGDALDVIVVVGVDKSASCDFRVKFPITHAGKRVLLKVNGNLCHGLEMVVTKETGTCKFTDGMSEKPSIKHFNNLVELLQEERNELSYQILNSDGSLLGTAEAYIFLWKSHYSIVVVDIDGTITRSNARGVWDTIVTENFEYVHGNVCLFFQTVIKEDIRVVYLTSRTISMARATRRFLVALEQDSHKLPLGPMLGHTGTLSKVLLSELVMKDIHQYKADSLFRQVVLVFAGAGRTNTSDLLRCAFGNTPTDSMAYEMAGIRLPHIYNIDKSSTISCLDRTYDQPSTRSDTVEERNHAPTMRLPRKRSDYSRLVGTTYKGYGDLNLLQNVQGKMNA